MKEDKFTKLCKIRPRLLEKISLRNITNEQYGQYIIRIQLIDEETGEIVDGSEINQNVSGDEYAWGKIEEIRNLLENESLEDIELGDEEDTSDLQDWLGVSTSY